MFQMFIFRCLRVKLQEQNQVFDLGWIYWEVEVKAEEDPGSYS